MEKVVANPFQTGGMIRQADKFIGRESELRQIFSRLASMQSVSVVGERRIGKSSLLMNIAQTGKDRLGNDFEVYYLDLERIFTVEEFYDQVCKLLGREEGATHADLAEAISRKKAIFCLDEFEQTDEENFDAEFFKSLRSLAQTGELALVVATQHPLSQLYRRHGNQTSPFQNIFTQLKLSELAPEEARRLVVAQNNGHSFNPDEIKFILDLAGNHPYWLNVVSAKLFDAKQRNGSKVDLTAIRQQVEEERKPVTASTASAATDSSGGKTVAEQSDVASSKASSPPATQSNVVILGIVALFTMVGGVTGWLAIQRSNPVGVIVSAAFLSTALGLFLYDFGKLISNRRRA